MSPNLCRKEGHSANRLEVFYTWTMFCEMEFGVSAKCIDSDKPALYAQAYRSRYILPLFNFFFMSASSLPHHPVNCEILFYYYCYHYYYCYYIYYH